MYLIPQPRREERGTGIYRLSWKGSIRLDGCREQALGYAALLQQEIREDLGFDWQITTVTGRSGKDGIILEIKEEDRPENYYLSVTEEGIRITGCDKAGLLYGVQTLRQMVRQCGAHLPVTEIWDGPEIPHRGFYQDVSRGRILTLEEMKKLVDTCSFYKLNQLQLYVETSYCFEGFSETWRDNTPLSAEEIMELDDYCASRQIELVPSLASFGHLYGVLRTRDYGHLCELEERVERFSMTDRMAHHTVDVSNEESFVMVRDRIRDFMRLFRSDKCNVCADETFDLGKGRSRLLAEEKGVSVIYLEFLNRLCQEILAQGKTPMFWGDVLIRHPECIEKLPRESIFLNWEYSPQVKEDQVETLSRVGVEKLYLCPGIQCWNHMIARHHDAYLNISKMCRNAHKYHVLGVLNTCWGDFGHIADPASSVIGLIYGSAFSWSSNILSEEEINRQISRVEYGDREEDIVAVLSELAEYDNSCWRELIYFREHMEKGGDPAEIAKRLPDRDMSGLEEQLRIAEEKMDLLYRKALTLSGSGKEKLAADIIMGEGQILWVRVWRAAVSVLTGEPSCTGEERRSLAVQLEEWYMEYKKLWRRSSKEGELFRLTEVVCWYADQLRREVPFS